MVDLALEDGKQAPRSFPEEMRTKAKEQAQAAGDQPELVGVVLGQAPWHQPRLGDGESYGGGQGPACGCSGSHSLKALPHVDRG